MYWIIAIGIFVLATNPASPERGFPFPIEQVEPYCTVPPQQVCITQLDQGPMSSGRIAGKYGAVSDADQYARLHACIYSNLFPPPPLPSIDFQTKLVIFAFMDTRISGGYSMKFSSVSRSDDAINVVIQTQSPGPSDLVTKAITNQFAIAKIDRCCYSQLRFLDEEGQLLRSVKLSELTQGQGNDTSSSEFICL